VVAGAAGLGAGPDSGSRTSAPSPGVLGERGRSRPAASPMGSNDPELGPRCTARPRSAAPGAFIYRKGRYSPLDTLDGRLTSHVGINNRGQIAGGYLPDGMTQRGFVRDERGTYTSFDAAPRRPDGGI
jgi:hypothetical protein